MDRLIKIVVTLVFLVFATNIYAAALDANLSYDSFVIRMDSPIKGAGGLNVSGEFMFSNNDFKRRVFLGSFGFYGVDTDNLEYRLGAGAKVYSYAYKHISQNSEYAFANNIALGGFFYHVIPKLNRFSLGAEFWYAPSVTSFNGTENLYELSARLAFRMIKNLDLYLGYRHIAMQPQNYACSFILDNSPYFGVRFNF